MSSWIPRQSCTRARGLCSQPAGGGRELCGPGNRWVPTPHNHFPRALLSLRGRAGPGGGSVWGPAVVACPPPTVPRSSEGQEPVRDALLVSASPLLSAHPTAPHPRKACFPAQRPRHQQQLASRPSVLASSLLPSWLSKNPPDALYPPLRALSLSLLSLSLEG